MMVDQATLARQTAFSLMLDAATAQVVTAFEQVGVPSMILKGPAIVERLYGDGAFRPYVDIDLLIPGECLPVATDALRRLGYAFAMERARPDEQDAIAQCWTRFSDGVSVDLHFAFHGIDPGGPAWPVLTAGASRRLVGGAKVLVPADDALALLTALHAAVTRIAVPKPIEDLDRAARIFTMDVWGKALRRAEATSSVEWMAAGLRRTPRGSTIAESLGLEPPRNVELLLHAQLGADPATSARKGAIHLARLSRLDGFGPRFRYVALKLFPSPTALRMSPGRRLPLVLAYPRRWWRVVPILTRGLGLFRRVRRSG